jgi:hypothetical protein
MWSLDRRVAASAVLVAALALAIPMAVADAPALELPGHERIDLALELAGLANRGTETGWMVTYEFTRTNAARNQLHDTILVAHVPAGGVRPSLDVDDGFGSLVVTAGSRTYSCTVRLEDPECLERATVDRAAHPGDVYGGSVVSGRYDISAAPSERIAGLEAQCFHLQLKQGNPVPGLGFSSQQCYSNAGVPLRSRVQGSTATDERLATTVRRTVGRADLLPLLAPYGLERLAPAR